MPSNRKKIRAQLVAILKNNTVAKDRVSGNRVRDIDDNTELPVISVLGRPEEVEKFSDAPRRLKRTYRIEVECYDEGETEEEVSDRLDDIADQVEILLLPTARNKNYMEWADLELSGEIITSIESQGERFFGSITLPFEVTYYRESVGSEDVQTLSELKKIHVDWRVGHHGEQTDTTTDAQNDVIISS